VIFATPQNKKINVFSTSIGMGQFMEGRLAYLLGLRLGQTLQAHGSIP